MLTGGMSLYYTESKWNNLGYQVYKSEIDCFKLENGLKVFDSSQVAQNICCCVVCKKEYNTDYCYFTKLVEKMKPVLKCEIKDNTCDDCIREILGLSEFDLLD